MKREWLIAARRQNCLSQAQIAKAVDISQAHYSMLESGKRNPTIALAKRISTCIGSIDWPDFFKE